MLVKFSRKMHIDMSMSKIYININSFLPAINLAAYFRVIGISQLQKCALRANKSSCGYLLGIHIEKNVPNFSTWWFLVRPLCTMNEKRYRFVPWGKWNILHTALYQAVHTCLKRELDKSQTWLPLSKNITEVIKYFYHHIIAWHKCSCCQFCRPSLHNRFWVMDNGCS